jgi:Putative transposase, YhgA-like
MLEIWQQDIINKRNLSVVIPIVFYQGTKKWEYRPFKDYFDYVPKELERFLPKFDYHCTSVRDTDLQNILDLPKGLFIRSLMHVYKKINDKDINIKNVNEYFDFNYKDLHKENLRSKHECK